jgi:hypothetical protein
MNKHAGENTSVYAGRDIDSRVVRAAEKTLSARNYVSSIDVLAGLGWLTPSQLDMWRQGRVEYLERVVQGNLNKISDAMKAFHAWAQRRGLKASETVCVARTRDHRKLRFSASGAPEIERRYRTHYVSPELSERKRARLMDKLGKAPELVVIDPIREWQCRLCGRSDGFIFMEGGGPLCLGCADLDHLVYLPAGDAALTRQAKSLSGLSAVVVRFSRSRGHYERQGILVEAGALERARAGCLADEGARRLS